MMILADTKIVLLADRYVRSICTKFRPGFVVYVLPCIVYLAHLQLLVKDTSVFL
jgi:hypothetical protein